MIRFDDHNIRTADLDGGELPEPYPRKYRVDSNDITLVEPIKNGYTFTGWTGGGITTPTKNVTIEHNSTTGDKTYTAHWTATEYDITYVLNGGTNAQSNPAKYTIESATITLDDPSKTNYDFLGWTGEGTTTPTKGVQIPNGSTGAKTYTANWKGQPLAVSFDVDYTGGQNPESVTVYYGETYGNLPSVTRTGYNFGGWYTEKGAAGTKVESTTAVSTTGTQTLYAHWTAITYTIAYNANGGTDAPSSQTKTYDVELKLETGVPTNTGYTFLGWARSSQSTTAEFAAGATLTSDLTTASGATVTLYAVWKAHTYEVHFNKGLDIAGTMDNQPFNYDEEKSLSKNQFTKWGYEFDSWIDTDEKEYSDQEKVKNLTSVDGATFTLNPQWNLVTYEASYSLAEGETMAGGGSNPFTYDVTDYIDPQTQETKDIAIENTANKDGYTFQGWDIYGAGEDPIDTAASALKYSKKIAENITLKANFEANKYNVTLNPRADIAEDATLDKDAVVVTFDEAYGNLPVPQSVKYHFVGWFTEDDKEIKSSDIYKVVGDQTLNAKWQINASSLDYEDEGDVVEINDAPDGIIYNDFEKPLIINTSTGSTVIPAGGIGQARTLDNYAGATSDTHLHEIVGYGSEKTHYIDLVVNALTSEDDKSLLIEEAKKRGFTNATEFNTLLFEAHVEIDGVETQIDGSLIISLILPPAMCNVPSRYNREFRVFHKLSDGTIKEEPIVSLDLANRIIKIKVTELSPFAIAFRDSLKPDGDSGRSLPVTGIVVEEGNNTLKLLSMFAIFALGMTFKIKNKVGKDYWDEFK